MPRRRGRSCSRCCRKTGRDRRTIRRRGARASLSLRWNAATSRSSGAAASGARGAAPPARRSVRDLRLAEQRAGVLGADGERRVHCFSAPAGRLTREAVRPSPTRASSRGRLHQLLTPRSTRKFLTRLHARAQKRLTIGGAVREKPLELGDRFVAALGPGRTFAARPGAAIARRHGEMRGRRRSPRRNFTQERIFAARAAS